MPITSPSYFPPSRANGSIIGITAGQNATGARNFLAGMAAGNNSTITDLIVIGDNSGKGAITDPFLNGTIIIGSQSGQSIVQESTSAPNLPGSNIILGFGTYKNITHLDSTIAIGQGIYPNSNDNQFATSGNVLIGNGIGAAATTNFITTSVVIGHSALSSVSAVCNAVDNVIIGFGALQNSANASSVTDNVIIGYKAGQSITGASGSSTQNVIIGSTADAGLASNANTVIGFLAKVASVLAAGSNVVIGNAALGAAVADVIGFNVVIGSIARSPSNANGRNVIIGAGAGSTLPITSGQLLVIETNLSSVQSALLYGSFASGNLIVGNSIDGTNRDFGGVPGTNMLKLLNGTKATVANVVGGGYFYVSGGILHWVDSSGNDLDFNGAVATGASTASFVSTNKPGATTGVGPATWQNVNVNGVSYQSPLWAT